jgi:predicted phosphodiesterase
VSRPESAAATVLRVRVAVISDIHGNLAALEAVLAEVDAAVPDEVWCLGDMTGYGAKPNECVDLVRERSDVCLVGNHDLVVRGDLSVDEFSPEAAAAATWSKSVLGEEERAYLRSLAPLGERAGVSLYHASIRDPIWEYVVNAEVARACLVKQKSELALIGHSHVPLALHLTAGTLRGGHAAGGSEYPLEERKCLLNPGSVGQPRDRDPRAAWLLLDLGQRVASFRRTDYDIVQAQGEIISAGLPQRLADRLAVGA